MVKISSFPGSVGERAVNWIEVKGKVDAFGFPASMEMRPGVFSNGMRIRTAPRDRMIRRLVHQFEERYSLGLGILVFETFDKNLS